MCVNRKRVSITRLILILIIIIELVIYGLLQLNNYLIQNIDQFTMNMLDDNIISFSMNSGVYNDEITVELKNNISLIGKNMTILYTLDGNDPYYNNEYYLDEDEIVKVEPTVYDEPIVIKCNENDFVVVPIKAVIFVNNKYTKVVEKTYIVSKGDLNQYFDLPIMSITANDHDLYDYYDGSIVPGYIYDKNILEEYKGINIGNIGEERVINAQVTIIDYNISDYYSNNEFVVAGTTSRAAVEHISFKIKNLDNKYRLNIENDIREYKTLKLKSGSQDYYMSNIRNSIASNISKEYNFDGAPITKRAVLFINGSFYSIIDIMDNNSSSNEKAKYNLPDKEIFEISSPTAICKISNDIDSESFEEYIEKTYDIDNLMKYISIEIFMNNTDWPQNNTKMWKYIGKNDSKNKYTDGKYRFILNDVDITWWDGPQYFYGIYGDTFDSIYNGEGKGSCQLFNRIIHNDRFKDILKNYLSDLITKMSNNNFIYDTIDDEYNRIAKSQEYFLQNSSDLYAEKENIKKMVTKRFDKILLIMNTYLNVRED